MVNPGTYDPYTASTEPSLCLKDIAIAILPEAIAFLPSNLLEEVESIILTSG